MKRTALILSLAVLVIGFTFTGCKKQAAESPGGTVVEEGTGPAAEAVEPENEKAGN